MPVSAHTVGRSARPHRLLLDERFLMAYAAGVPDRSPELYDTTGALRCHPMYPVSPEWQLLIDNADLLAADLSPDESRRGVLAEHHIVLHRPLRPGMQVTVDAQVVGVDRRRSGAARVIEFRASDDISARLWTSTLASVFRGVELDGEPMGIRAVVTPDKPAAGDPMAEIPVDVGPADAHVYTECARIWNPIHTDVAVAHAAGLPSPILHGTATLARAVSALSAWSGNPVWTASRIACRFSAMVPNGTKIVIRVLSATRVRIRFDVRNHAGEPAIRDGVVEFATPG